MLPTDDVPPSVVKALEAGVPAVKAFREASGESLVGFSDLIAMDPERLKALEAGQTPSQAEIGTIASGLGITVDALSQALE